VDATNNLAERVMRLLVVMRKNWGGNRTENGARAQAVLTSVLCTAKQQDKDAFELLTDLLRSPGPKLLDLLPKVTAESEAESAAGERAGPAPPPRRNPRAETPLPDYADVPVPVLPDWRPAAGPESFFSSA
jgi:hypothetical protein